MSKTGRTNPRRRPSRRNRPNRRITVYSERRGVPDLRKLGRAVIAAAMAEAEAQALAAGSEEEERDHDD
ncbi:hypothetical protein ACFYTQ_27800 [Nocardia sp. NPDC004068]|uniref:hypothetical protein n=1 Tax=Nocardia sp. NPDC004068 TaxID=3364303 RepID=UPI0036ABEB8F